MISLTRSNFHVFSTRWCKTSTFPRSDSTSKPKHHALVRDGRWRRDGDWSAGFRYKSWLVCCPLLPLLIVTFNSYSIDPIVVLVVLFVFPADGFTQKRILFRWYIANDLHKAETMMWLCVEEETQKTSRLIKLTWKQKNEKLCVFSMLHSGHDIEWKIITFRLRNDLN